MAFRAEIPIYFIREGPLAGYFRDAQGRVLAVSIGGECRRVAGLESLEGDDLLGGPEDVGANGSEVAGALRAAEVEELATDEDNEIQSASPAPTSASSTPAFATNGIANHQATKPETASSSAEHAPGPTSTPPVAASAIEKNPASSASSTSLPTRKRQGKVSRIPTMLGGGFGHAIGGRGRC